MKKTTVWLALLAFCGTNTPVAAVESSQGLDSFSHTVSIDKNYWTADHANKTITSNPIFRQGKSFKITDLDKIFNNLAKFLNESKNSNEQISNNYKIYIGDLFLSGYEGETIDLSPIAKHIHRIGNGFMCHAAALKQFDTRDFTNLEEIKKSFLAGATSLEFFDARGLSKLKKIGHLSFNFQSQELFSANKTRDITTIGDLPFNFQSQELFSAKIKTALNTIGDLRATNTIGDLPLVGTLVNKFVVPPPSSLSNPVGTMLVSWLQTFMSNRNNINDTVMMCFPSPDVGQKDPEDFNSTASLGIPVAKLMNPLKYGVIHIKEKHCTHEKRIRKMEKKI